MIPGRGQAVCGRQYGFTLIELIVVIIVISLLAAAALERLLYYEERAEKAAMDYTLASIKTGLQIRMAELIIANRQAEVPQLERENPVQWLIEPPPSYVGEYHAPLARGNWAFDSARRQIVYAPDSTAHLDAGNNGDNELRFAVHVLYEPVPGVASRVPAGVTLVAANPYRWF